MIKHERGPLSTGLACLLGLCLLLSTGCQSALAADLMANVKAAEWPAQPDPPIAPFKDAISKFSWKLLQQSASNEGNILISPASVYLALVMALNGADTTTRTAMLQALAAEGLPVAALNTACRDWMTLLAGSGESASLTIANAIWYRTGFNPDRDFLQTNADFFAAGARMIDFNKPEAVTTINGWVKTATKGTIEKILDNIDPAVVMYLINTIYFKADWKTPFIKNYTAEGDFVTPKGVVKAQFMHRTGNLAYLEKGHLTGILLPYANEQYAFFAVLPAQDQDPRQLIQVEAADFLTSLLKTSRPADVNLYLPQFEARYEDSLLNELKSLGMGIAFQGGLADFSLMETGRGRNLFISEVKHKTFCKINEIGTEAAAATLVEISKSSLPAGEIKLTFNRPFIYGILDQYSGLPIFIGVVENPTR